MDKLWGVFVEDRQVLLLVFLFLVLLGVSLHLHGDLNGEPVNAQLLELTRWTREATAGVLGAIMIKIQPGQKGEGK